jgi:CRP/FNR family cyclic AMP-dependent transcriptional regulator
MADTGGRPVKDDEVVDQLSSVDLFSALSRRELKRLARGARKVVHTDGQRVIDRGGQPLGFHLIVDGAATVERPNGERIPLGKGDYFGEMSLIDGQPRSASVVANGDLRTVSLDSSTFNALLDEHPEASRVVMKALSKRLRSLDEGSVAG